MDDEENTECVRLCDLIIPIGDDFAIEGHFLKYDGEKLNLNSINSYKGEAWAILQNKLDLEENIDLELPKRAVWDKVANEGLSSDKEPYYLTVTISGKRKHDNVTKENMTFFSTQELFGLQGFNFEGFLLAKDHFFFTRQTTFSRFTKILAKNCESDEVQLNLLNAKWDVIKRRMKIEEPVYSLFINMIEKRVKPAITTSGKLGLYLKDYRKVKLRTHCIPSSFFSNLPADQFKSDCTTSHGQTSYDHSTLAFLSDSNKLIYMKRPFPLSKSDIPKDYRKAYTKLFHLFFSGNVYSPCKSADAKLYIFMTLPFMF